MKISKHAKRRMRERTDLNHVERRNLFRQALDKGQSLADIENRKVYNFVLSKQNTTKCKIKVYKDYLFLYGKNSKILYTMYKLPKGILESEVIEDENKM